jgi:hypothetical protein
MYLIYPVAVINVIIGQWWLALRAYFLSCYSLLFGKVDHTKHYYNAFRMMTLDKEAVLEACIAPVTTEIQACKFTKDFYCKQEGSCLFL